jgi:hypothetical protein
VSTPDAADAERRMRDLLGRLASEPEPKEAARLMREYDRLAGEHRRQNDAVDNGADDA